MERGGKSKEEHRGTVIGRLNFSFPMDAGKKEKEREVTFDSATVTTVRDRGGGKGRIQMLICGAVSPSLRRGEGKREVTADLQTLESE